MEFAEDIGELQNKKSEKCRIITKPREQGLEMDWNQGILGAMNQKLPEKN